LKKPFISIVDDDSGFANYLRTFLSLRGYETRSYSRGDEIVASIKQGDPPDVVLLDVMMPGKSGWEVARALKQDPVTQHVKIVMVSAIGEKTNEITAPIYGADAHVDKPFEFEKLEKVIAGLLG
jgi:CheY-like chemotaxis protein